MQRAICLMKKLCITIMLILVLGVFWGNTLCEARESYLANDGTYYYTLSDGEATIVGFAGASRTLTIPDKIVFDSLRWYPVTSIADSAFADETYVKSVIIPSSVTSLGNSVFSGCSGLESVSIPSSVTSLGSSMFSGCSSLTRVSIPSKVTRIGSSAFNGCSSLKSISMPTSLKYIGMNAFRGCSSLTSIDIPSNVTDIDWSAFRGCSSLKSISIPSKVTTIEQLVFADCSSLTSVTIPSSVTSIENAAFSGCSSLTSVTIPNRVTSIGPSAFSGCSSLTSVTIPNRVTSIGPSAFSGCSSLTSVTIPSSATSLGDKVFQGCSKLKSISIQSSITSIGTSMFSGCSSLTSVTIPSSVTSIENAAFSGCSSLTSINLPSNVTSLGSSSFSGCSSLTSVSIPQNITSISDSAFYNCTELTSVTIGSGVVTIDDSAFSQCKKLESVTMGGNVSQIGSYAFKGCSNLVNISIPNSIRSISASAFLNCDNLVYNIYKNGKYLGNSNTPYLVLAKVVTTEISDFEMAAGIKHIMGSTFLACSRLEDVWYLGSNTDKESLIIDVNNEPLNSAVWHYNTCEGEHTYLTECDSSCEKCEWSRNIEISANIGHDFSLNSCLTCKVCGYSKRPTKPQIKSKTGKTVQLVEEEFYEYSMDGETWQDSYIFTNLSCNTEYMFYQRVKATASILVSEKSEGLTVTTDEHLYSLNSNSTCEYCGYSRKPAQPVVGNHFSGTVELVVAEGMEYSKDGVTWQQSNVFGGLIGNATYIFYQRVKATSNVKVSEASEGLSVYLKATQSKLSSPTLSSYTDKTVTLIPLVGAEYSLDGIEWQESNVFKNLAAGTKYTFYQRYAETDTHEASPASTGMSVTTDKSKQTLIPATPTVQSVTSSSITLIAVDGCEYSKNGTTWQTSNVFSGLSCGTEYTFYQRYKETSSTYVGKSSEGGIGRTDKGTQSSPSKPTFSTKTHNSVTLVAYSGYEYSKDGINWQTSNVFTGLNPETNYLFYQRKAETDTHYASKSSSSLTVKTKEMYQSIIVSTLPNKTSYLEGKDKLDLTGGKIALCYPDGSMEEIAMAADMVTGFDNTIVGNQTITVTYGGKTASFTVIVDMSGAWKQNSVGWWYQHTDGTYPASCWEKINNQWYYFDASGYRVTGWLLLGTDYYYLDSNGVRVTNCWIGNYYLKDTGIMAKNEIVDGIYVGAGGEKFTGWLLKSEGYYYYKDGTKVTGWVLAGSTWYYMNPETGVMLANEWLDDTYYLTAGGAMATGWLSVDGTWYYMSAGGAKVTNSWVGNYYMGEDGVMAINAWVDNGRYYVDASGAYVSTSGWFFLDGNYYYLAGGLKQTGWLQAGGTWYYMDPETGVMLADEWLDDTYYMTASGAMATGWIKIGESWYYMSAGGAKITNQWMGNYYLQEDGTMATNTWIGNYYVGADGAWVQ